LLIRAAFIREQDDPRPLYHALLGFALPEPALQRLQFLVRQAKRRG